MRKNKILTFYSLNYVPEKNPDESPHILSIAVSKDDLVEYAHIWLRNYLIDEYIQWADDEDLDWEEWATWNLYFDTEVSQTLKDRLKVQKMKFKASDIAAMLRMFGSCKPIGCSFETHLEDAYFDNLDRISELEDKYM